jgi:hypothetical protein
MTKTIFVLAAGATGLLVSCEPLPPYPPPGYRPQPGVYGPQANGNPYGQNNREPQNPNAPLYGANGNQSGGDNGYGTPPPVTPPAPPASPPREEYPTAERTANPNQVISPYAPYNVIDVEGFRAGQLAKDPSNGKIFRVP